LRKTLILVSIDGLSHTEAAEVLGCPEGTIAWRIHEATEEAAVRISEKRGYPEGKCHELG
jgi:RNA polymerase sigma-70 factor (ECF subfamily)